MEQKVKESRAEGVYDGALFCRSPVYRSKKAECGLALPGVFTPLISPVPLCFHYTGREWKW